jgi:hypothetical protein
MNINSLAGCKTLIKSLTKEQAKNYPWKFVNSNFHPVFGKVKYPGDGGGRRNAAGGEMLSNRELRLLAWRIGRLGDPESREYSGYAGADERWERISEWRWKEIRDVVSFLKKKGYTVSLNIPEMIRENPLVVPISGHSRFLVSRRGVPSWSSGAWHAGQRWPLTQRERWAEAVQLGGLYRYNIWNVDYNLKKEPTICYGNKDCTEFYTKCHWLNSLHQERYRTRIIGKNYDNYTVKELRSLCRKLGLDRMVWPRGKWRSYDPAAYPVWTPFSKLRKRGLINLLI